MDNPIPIDLNELFSLIGQKEVELIVLRRELNKANQTIAELTKKPEAKPDEVS